MARTISSGLIPPKNDLAQANPWVLLVEVINASATSMRLTDNTETVHWNGYDWSPFPIQLESIGETSQGETPGVRLAVSNVEHAVQAALGSVGGLIGQKAVLRLVHAANLSLTSVPAYEYDIISAEADARFISFNLSARSPYESQVPRHRMLKNSCRFKFKSDECGYAGAETACDKTLTRCRVLSNSANFGGFPGLGLSEGLYA